MNRKQKDEETTKFWERVKALLREKEISQEILSEGLDMNKRAVATWITRNSTPDVFDVMQMSFALEVSIYDLLGINDPDDSSKKIRELAEEIVALTKGHLPRQ